MINTDRLKTQFQAAGQGDVIRAFGEIAAASRASSMAVGGSSARMASALGSIVGTVAVLGTAVAAATAAIGVASVKAAAPIENLQMRFRFAFGDMADAAMASSERIAKSLKRDVEEVQALVLTAKNLEVPNVGRAVSAAYNVSARNVPSQDIEKTATALVDIFGKIQQMDKIGGREVRQMLKAILPGGTMIEQVMKDMGMAGETEMSGRAALPKLIEVLEKYGGDAALQEAKTLSGLMRQTKDKVGDVFESIGLQLLPVARKVLESFEPLLNDTQGIARFAAKIVEGVAFLGRWIAGIGLVLYTIRDIFTGFRKGIIDTFIGLGAKIAEVILGALAKIRGFGRLQDSATAAGNLAESKWAAARKELNPMTYVNQYNTIAANINKYFVDPMNAIVRGLRAVKNGASSPVGAVDPLANAATDNMGKKVSEGITQAVQRYIIGGGSQAGQWMRMLDVGGRAAGAGAIPVKLSEQTGDAFKKFLVQAMSETLVDVLKSPQGKRAIAAAATAR